MVFWKTFSLIIFLLLWTFSLIWTILAGTKGGHKTGIGCILLCTATGAFENTFVVGVAVLTVELVVPDADVGAGAAVAELHVADAALEAPQVVEQPQRLDYHGGTAT